MEDALVVGLEPAPLVQAWYAAGPVRALRHGPRAFTVCGVPLVVFASGAGFGALVDRCPHRGAPLSLGRAQGGLLTCPYHGWRFDAAGRCAEIPASVREGGRGRAHDATVRPVRAQQGVVWVCPGATPPEEDPPRFPHLDDPAYASTLEEAEMPAGLVATAENILDVPHTSFLHGGWFRRAPERTIRAEVRRDARSCAARFVGERAPSGLLGRLLAPGAEGIEHEDRFALPAQAEVEYRLGDNHLVITSALTPIDARRTKVTAVASLRLRWGSRLVAQLARPFARRVLAQDAAMLGAIAENERRFSAPILEIEAARPVSTEVDLLGPQIARLLRDAGRGASSPLFARDVELRI